MLINITVKTADVNEVGIVSRLVIDSNAEKAASKALEKLSLSLEQKGNDVFAIADYEKRVGNVWGNWPYVQVSYTITVLRTFNLRLITSGGNVTVSVPRDAGFYLEAYTSGGDVETRNLRLSNAKVNRTKSSLSAAVNAGGPKFNLRTKRKRPH